MRRNLQITIIFFITLSIAFSVILYWYRGDREPLSSQEIASYINAIESQSQRPGGKHDIPTLRKFLENDDGKPFYTVNLYKYFEQAQYLGDQHSQVTGREAFDRFTSVMIGLLAQHSSHPIFGSDWADKESSEWDRIVIVRYRSRRDIASIFASPEFAEASAHKWAGVERNERMLVQALHIPELYIPVVLLFFLIGLIFFVVLRQDFQP